MHTFQPYPIELVEMNPFTKIGKEWALVTAGSKAKCNTIILNFLYFHNFLLKLFPTCVTMKHEFY